MKSVGASGRSVGRLCGVPDAFAEQAAAADGDLGLSEVVAVAGKVPLGVQEHEQAAALVVLQERYSHVPSDCWYFSSSSTANTAAMAAMPAMSVMSR